MYLLFAGATGGCRKPPEKPTPPPPAVTVAKPIWREVIEWDEYTGRLEPVEMVEVRARVSGYIEKAEFAEGSLIKAGDTLFEIDVRPFAAALAKAQADVQRGEAQLAYATNEFKRLESIRSTGVASELELENARQRMKEAEAVVAGANADTREAQLDVDWCKVTAPISGRISKKYVTPGNLVNGGTGNTTLLTTIASVDPIYCTIEADERSVLKYQKLSAEKKRVSARDSKIPCVLALANEEGFPHEGLVDFVDNQIDPQTGTLRARGVFHNPNGYLLPGMFARVRIPGSGRYKALLVPDAAIGTDQNQKFLLVADANNVVQYKLVKIGALFGGARVIEEGITDQDRVIINGRQRAMPGVTVNPTEVTYEATVPLTAPGSPSTQELPQRPTTTQPAQPSSQPAAQEGGAR
jgi:RND family efflux transporter MFP subunit